MTAYEGLFYFLVYSLLGWLLENVYSLSTQGVFWKEGFLKSPLKPMYGIAPLLLLSLRGDGQHAFIVALGCLLIPTIVEYLSGYLLFTFFGKRWWDYSELRGQLHGHICFRFSMYWAVLSVLVLEFLHPQIEVIYRSMEEVWEPASLLFLLLFVSDLLWTCWDRRREWRRSLV
ncbi:putative ABC transporter permease [Paenibacillus puldeungensis]|uniref:ABC transporter permease n=1 Tax=Paenibacillus puldeungensis TaxID=696536 RepID=A0ABW3RW15_9BACL